MNDSENFLGRWSRRKREAFAAQPEKTGDAVTPGLPEDRKTSPGNPISEPVAPPVPAFDISKLPPIESIGADTDISAFMQTGVPSALRHAALRRAWSADPAIRDFMGPTENYWDAAGPDGVPGFGDLDPGLDVKRLVSELFGETPHKSAEAVLPDSSGTSAPRDKNFDNLTPNKQTALPSGDDVSHRIENGATQNNPGEPQPAKKLARRHGGALPK